VSEGRHQIAEVSARAAEQGGGVRGWFVAVNQQWNPAYGIFEHGDQAITAAQAGDWRGVGAETTHTAIAVASTVAVAEAGAALAEGALARGAVPKASTPPVETGGPPSGGGPLFPGVADAEVGTAVDTATSGTPAKLPGQNPRTGEGLLNHVQKFDPQKPIAHHDNMKFKGIKDAPGGKVEVRRHSANPNAPAGSYSQTNPTTQVNSVNPKTYMLPDGTFKPLGTMTEGEKASAHFP
jgi:hypothetical protein